MKRKLSLFKSALLGAFSLSFVAGLIATDYYMRHEPTRKATRALNALEIPVSADSAVEAAIAGKHDLLNLLETARVDLGAADSNGITPLVAALRAGKGETVDFLLLRERVVANIDQPAPDNGVTPLGQALTDRDYLRADRFLKMGADPNVFVEQDEPLLLSSVKSGDESLMKFLLDSGADANLKGEQSHPALIHAVEKGNFKIIQDLLNAGAEVDIDNNSGNPLIVDVVKQGNHQLAELLIEKGASVNKTVTEGLPLTPLAIAIQQQDGWLIRELLEAGADPNVTGQLGDPLLVEAVNDRDHDLANLLLEFGADTREISTAGESALALAVRSGDLTMADILLDHGADPDFNNNTENSETPLEIAARDQDVAMMRELVGAGADANRNDIVLATFENRDFPGLKLLLDAGADPEAYDEDGRRVLDMAVASGSVESVRIMLEAGADAGGKLWSALRSGNDELVSLVLTYGAQVNEFDRLGGHPLNFALENERYDTAKMLLERGANPNIMRNEKESWLAASIRLGNKEMADTLLSYGACPDGMKSEDGHSLLAWCIARGYSELAVRLIDAGADVRAREPSPATSSFREQFKSNTFKYHLLKDARINPLMMAAAQQNHEIAQALIDAGAKASDYSRKYLWPVNIGAWYNDVKMMQIILGVDPDIEKQPRHVVVDLSRQRLTLYEHGKATFSGPVSTGRRGNRTPTGEYVITDKHKRHTSSIYGSSMPYFQRLSCAAFGFHQGHLPGYPASHGCIRMTWSGAKTMFYKTEVGDRVTIRY